MPCPVYRVQGSGYVKPNSSPSTSELDKALQARITEREKQDVKLFPNEKSMGK